MKDKKNELLHDMKEIAEHAVSVKLAADEMQQICEKDTVMLPICLNTDACMHASFSPNAGKKLALPAAF